MSEAPKGDKAEGAAPEAPAKPKSKLPLMAGAAVLVLAGAGGAGYWWWSHRAPVDPKAAEAAAKEEEHAPDDAGIVGFEPFVANLADEGGSRFLRANLKLVVQEDGQQASQEEQSGVRPRRQPQRRRSWRDEEATFEVLV